MDDLLKFSLVQINLYNMYRKKALSEEDNLAAKSWNKKIVKIKKIIAILSND